MDTILIVDDDQDVLDFERRQVAKIVENVRVAKSGTEALESIKNKKPSLVLLDWMMPGPDGMWTLKEIKKRWPDLPVIMVTAVTDEPHKQLALNAGANDYITKPIDVEYLKVSIITELFTQGV